MDIDRNLIRHWAKLFESECGMDGGESFLEEDDDGAPKTLTQKMVEKMLPRDATEF